MADKKYYDGAKLMSLLDLDKKVPEIFFSASNRSAGKTTYFTKMLLRRFLKHGSKVLLLVRYGYECEGAMENFLSAVQLAGYYKNLTCKAEPRARGKYYETYINDQPFGYVVSLSAADFVKKKSSLFASVSAIFMDEVCPEDERYLPREFKFFMSIHTSVARGGGEQKKYLPVYMCSNLISVLNPYFQGWGITDKIPKDCTFFRWYGLVLEIGFNEAAAEAQKASGVMRAARGDTAYSDYAQKKSSFLMDNADMVEKKTGRSHYWATLLYDGKYYGCRIFADGYMYIDNSPDMGYDIVVATRDSMKNDVFANGYLTVVRKQLVEFFSRGKVLFKNQECKQIFLNFI